MARRFQVRLIWHAEDGRSLPPITATLYPHANNPYGARLVAQTLQERYGADDYEIGPSDDAG